MYTVDMTNTQKSLLEALEAAGYEALAGKGGFWVRREGVTLGHFTAAEARKLEGVVAPGPVKRQPRERQAPWGQMAEIAAISRRLRG